MGAPPIYSLSAGRRKSGGMLSNVSPSIDANGLNSRVGMNYEKHLKVAIDDETTNGSVCNSEVISPSFFGRPFSAGNLQQKGIRWNPFKKKSGILGVIHAQSKRNRVVSKHGKLNTFRRREENQDQHRYLKDFFTSIIDLSWSTTLFSFALSFFFSWLFFAVIWYILVLIHGDLSEDRAPDHKVCILNINDFTSCFLFSMETQHTIGYGVRATTEQCFGALIVMSIQCIVGVVIQACMAGIVFAKFTKPTMRAETILFSKNALITLRNGSLYLVCRIGDLRPTHLLESHFSGHMLKKEVTEEGEEIPYHLERMEFGTELDGTQDFFQMFWPITVSHKIDEDSPLWEMSPRDILAKQFEIILTMEGITPETGNTIQVRTSYLPNEILWGYRFAHECVFYDKTCAKYAVSLTALNKFIQDKTPRCSSIEWEENKAKKATEAARVELESNCMKANQEIVPENTDVQIEAAKCNNKSGGDHMVLPQVLALEDHEPNLLEQAEDSPLNHLNIGNLSTCGVLDIQSQCGLNQEAPGGLSPQFAGCLDESNLDMISSKPRNHVHSSDLWSSSASNSALTHPQNISSASNSALTHPQNISSASNSALTHPQNISSASNSALTHPQNIRALSNNTMCKEPSSSFADPSTSTSSIKELCSDT